MGRKSIAIIISIALAAFIILLFTMKAPDSEAEYFNQVELSDNNFIPNPNGIAFYDTIISVGLDNAGISGVNVVVSELSNSAKEQFTSGELKAHVRYFNGTFYLFLDKYGRKEAMDVISHEIIHMVQYTTGQLIYENGVLYWEGLIYDLENLDYENRPWERDAFSRESDLSLKVYNTLYKN